MERQDSRTNPQNIKFNKSQKCGELIGLTINADILTNKMPELEFILESTSADFAFVSEVLPKSRDRIYHHEEFEIQGYEKIPHETLVENSPTSKGRGSILYIKKTLTYKEYVFNAPVCDFEESIAAEITINSKETLLCTGVYRRGKSSDNGDR